MSKVWFITGVSRGLGREWASAALERGDRVAGTARDLAALTDLVTEFPETFLPLQLNVTDRPADFAAVEEAAQHFGRLDVVVNNAGYMQFGMVEELTEQQIRGELETNLLGALWVTQAALPILRAQGSGHIIQVSSLWGIVASPNAGAYNASKWALEGLSQSLAAEVSDLGIHVTILEPASYDTGFKLTQFATPNPAYSHLRTTADPSGHPLGDPTSTRTALLALVDAEKPPLRLLLGQSALQIVTTEYESRLALWRGEDSIDRPRHQAVGEDAGEDDEKDQA
ncbi:SDR family NAD(P)-dependent oxidoreductase [Nocardia sp. NPDC088792]|uniref:SDR family NAD(P)-dependent oxidoreductase n=1 Tax=Nocardia sp. NPDC088792 TaxID=3364332 RepID=UPI00382EDED3